MSDIDREAKRPAGIRRPVAVLLLFSMMALSFRWPDQAVGTLIFVTRSLIAVAPWVVPGLILSAWLVASSVIGRLTRLFDANPGTAVLLASAAGALSPVCGVTVLPLMAGLLASGVPLAPVMAFWLASPVTDPGILAATAATLGLPFAIGKTLAAFGLGLFGGFAATIFASLTWARTPLRPGRLTAGLVGQSSCSSSLGFKWAVWAEPGRRDQFLIHFWTTGRLVVICLGLAFAAEFLMRQFLQPETLTAYVGAQSTWAVPLAVLVGAPAYLDGYAALPLTRGMIDHGMSPGAAMAFLVSGGVVSIWGALAIAPILRVQPFLLYLSLAVVGSMLAGWLYGLVS